MAHHRTQGRAVPGHRFNGDRFGELCLERGLSLSEVSRRTAGPGGDPAPVPVPHLSQYRAGALTPRPERLARIAAVLGVKPRELLTAA